MADRKGRSVKFRTPERIGFGDLKAAIEKVFQDTIVAFQDLGDGVYLLELQSRGDAEVLVNNGFDISEFHVDCSPPHSKFLNGSLMFLRSYVEDEEVKSVLSEYGELKSEVIRLKYKADHDLAGLENGNRLAKMVLEKPTVPYSLRIGGEWCRVIQNNQQKVCTECSELGHTKRNCPRIRSHVCKQLGHMSYSCEQREEQDGEAPDKQSATNEEQPEASGGHSRATGGDDNGNENIQPNIDSPINKDPHPDSNKEDMDYDYRAQNLKRQHVTDSDSHKASSARRPKLKPVLNLSTRRKVDKKNAKASESYLRSSCGICVFIFL